MTVLMTELIDMFMLYLMFLLYYAIADPARLRHRDDGVYRYVLDDRVNRYVRAVPDIPALLRHR